MRLEDTRRWHWMLIAPFIGVLIGYVRYSSDPAGIGEAEHLEVKNGFEPRLVSVQKLKGGGERRLFDDVRVVRTWIHVAKDKPERRYVVVGMNMVKHKDGATELRDLKPTFVVTEDKYVPQMVKTKPGTGFPPPSYLDRLQVVAEKLKLKDPDPKDTVIDYLKQLQVEQGIAFRYEWWRERKVSMVMWAAGCFVVIGVVWPTLINLIAFGSPFRPREEKASKKKSKSTETGLKPKVTASDMEELRRLEEEMERKLKEGAPERGIGVGPADKPAEAPIKPLTGTETVAAIPAAEKQDQGRKAFGMDGDDLYPTEVHGHTKKHGE